jgi:Skp family chaperone for outer membrane proteins
MIVKSLDDGSEIPANIGAKAVHVTVDTIKNKTYENLQDALQQLVNADNQLQTNIDNEVEAREAAITAEQEAREKDINDVLLALATEVTDRQTAINTAITKEITDRDNAISEAIEELNLPNQFDGLADDIAALEEKLLYTASADAVAITEDTVLNLSEETYKYILIYCEYNGKRMPVYQVLADGASSEVIYHSLTEDGVCYIGMNMLVSENTLAISNIINSNDTAEFKILNIYGCV